jgi:hypothetical protein
MSESWLGEGGNTLDLYRHLCSKTMGTVALAKVEPNGFPTKMTTQSSTTAEGGTISVHGRLSTSVLQKALHRRLRYHTVILRS